MNIAKLGVIALSALTIGALAYVFIITPLSETRSTPAESAIVPPNYSEADVNFTKSAKARPRIAILTDTTIDVIETRIETIHNPEKDSKDIAEKAGEHASTLYAASLDFLSTNLSSALTRTGRLTVLDPQRVETTISEMGGSAVVSLEPDGGENVPDSSATELLRGIINEVFNQSRQSDDGETITTEETTRYSAAANESAIAQAAKMLDATHILAVYVSEPRYQDVHQTVPGSSQHIHVITSSPSISYRLYHRDSGTVILSNVTRPVEPIEVPYIVGSRPQNSAFTEARLALGNHIAEMVASDMMDVIFPAQIVIANNDLLAVDRGNNDGIQVGDIFEVSRNQGFVSGARGVALNEQVRVPVGTVRVNRVQETLSYVEPLSGGPFQLDDVLEISGSDYDERRKVRPQRSGEQSQRPSNPALGVQMMNETRQSKPTVAVRNLSVSYIDCRRCPDLQSSGELIEASFVDSLSKEDRVSVVSRQDMDALFDERLIGDQSTGANLRVGYEGTAAAGYVLQGDLSITPRSSVSTQRVAGRVIESEPTYSLKTQGLVQIVNTESFEIVRSTRVDFTMPGSVSETNLRRIGLRAADQVTVSLLDYLFPLAVLGQQSSELVEISGGLQAGLTVGTRLQVYSVGGAMDDLYSSSQDTTRQKTGVLVVTDSRDTRATAKFEGQPFGIKRGDQLEVLAKLHRPTSDSREASAKKETSFEETEPQSLDADDF